MVAEGLPIFLLWVVVSHDQKTIRRRRSWRSAFWTAYRRPRNDHTNLASKVATRKFLLDADCWRPSKVHVLRKYRSYPGVPVQCKYSQYLGISLLTICGVESYKFLENGKDWKRVVSCSTRLQLFRHVSFSASFSQTTISESSGFSTENEEAQWRLASPVLSSIRKIRAYTIALSLNLSPHQFCHTKHIHSFEKTLIWLVPLSLPSLFHY